MRAKTINELQNFERGQDPKIAMGIGRKAQIHKDFANIGYEKDDIKIINNHIILPNTMGIRGYDFRNLQLKYLDPKAKIFAKEIIMKNQYWRFESNPQYQGMELSYQIIIDKNWNKLSSVEMIIISQEYIDDPKIEEYITAYIMAKQIEE